MLNKNAARQLFSLSAVMATGLLSSVTALAQQEAEELKPALEEVIVTAQKREQSIQDISISIKALSAETLETVKADSLDDIVRLVPSLSMTDLSRGGNNVQIRGLGSNVGNVGTVAIYNDGVISAGRIQSSGTFAEADPALFDIERVEVLRGPQGTLYGEGSFGGVINIISKKPDATKFSAAAGGTWFDTKGGSGDNYDLNGMLNIPIAKDTLAARVVAYTYDHSGYIDLVNVLPLFFGAPPEFVEEDANTEKVTGGRAMLRWTPSESIDATLMYKSEDQELGISNYDSPGLISLVNALAGTDFSERFTQAGFDSAFGSETETDEVVLTVDVDTRVGSLTSITGWGEITQEAASTLMADSEAFSQELRLSSDNDGSLNWTVGAYYRSASRDIEAFGAPFNSNENDQWSVFGQLYWRFAESWMATVGLRYGDQTVKSTDSLLGLPTVSQSFDDVSPKFALDWNINEDTLAYASIAKGFRAGGTNTDESLGTDPTFTLGFEPDYVWNYELGLKTALFEDKMILNAAVFYVDWNDIQIDKAINSVVNPPYQFIVTNGDNAHSVGVEADLYFYPAESWEIVVGGSLLEAKFDDGTIDSASAGLGVPLKDQWLASAPDYTFNASVEKKWAYSSQLQGFARADFAARGNSYGDVPNQAPPGGSFESGSLTSINLRTGISHDSWSIQAFVTNLTDEYVSTFNYYDGGFADVHVVLRPRTYGLSFRYNYN